MTVALYDKDKKNKNKTDVSALHVYNRNLPLLQKDCQLRTTVGLTKLSYCDHFKIKQLFMLHSRKELPVLHHFLKM